MKSSNKKLAAKILLMLALGLYHSIPVAYALPSQGTLDNSKAATITTSENMMNIVGKGKNNILNWANFQIGKGETVKFNDKNNYLNLVHGVDISRIYGTLSGGNIVYLVNPNGILFGQGTKLDNVGSFVASTRNISSINKEAFLQEPTNTAAVLGTDNPVMDNKDYYPEDSSYVPKISVAEMQLTNVPASATSIILDGPGGVILKNIELLDKMTQVITRKDGGEIGIGSNNGNVELDEAQKHKIALLDGGKVYAYEDSSNVLQGYHSIKNIDEFVAMDTDIRGKDAKKYILVNDIVAEDNFRYVPICANGTFEGLGYTISNMVIDTSNDSYVGLFSMFEGDLRNLSINNISFSDLYSSYRIGGAVGSFKKGSISNVHVTGEIKGNLDEYGKPDIGGIVGYMDTGSGRTEVRNSGSYVNIETSTGWGFFGGPHNVGGVVGNVETTSAGQSYGGGLYNVYNYGRLNDNVGQQDVFIGGIVGNVYDCYIAGKKFDILGTYNCGDIFVKYGNPLFWVDVNAGGILGYVESANINIGDNYNFGSCSVHTDSNPDPGVLCAGGVIGKIDPNLYDYCEDPIVKDKISMHGDVMKSYYILNTGNFAYNTDIGVMQTANEILGHFDKVMIGAYDFSKYHSDVTSGVPDVPVVPPVNPEPDVPVVPPVNPESDVPVVPPINLEPDKPDFNPDENKNDDFGQGKTESIIRDKEYDNVMTEVKETEDNPKIYWDGSGTSPQIIYTVVKDRIYEDKIFYKSMNWADAIPENEEVYMLISDEQYNGFYKIDGNMYIKDIKTETVKENAKTIVTFDVYNRESVSGVVEVYDAAGNKIKTEWVLPFTSHAESVKETFEDIFKIGTNELRAERTSVEIEVPIGGYFRITNNENNSSSLKLHNYIVNAINNTEAFVKLVWKVDELILDSINKEQVNNALVDAITDVIQEKLEGLVLDTGVDYYTTGIYEVVDGVIKSEEGGNLFFNAIVDKLKQDLTAKGIAEAVFWQGIDDVSAFTKPVQDALFAFSKVCNRIEQGFSQKKTATAKATNFVVRH